MKANKSAASRAALRVVVGSSARVQSNWLACQMQDAWKAAATRESRPYRVVWSVFCQKLVCYPGLIGSQVRAERAEGADQAPTPLVSIGAASSAPNMFKIAFTGTRNTTCTTEDASMPTHKD